MLFSQCRHRDQVGKRARKLRKSITIVDPTIIPSPERTQPKDLIEWFEHNEIPEDVQASLRELGLENVRSCSFLVLSSSISVPELQLERTHMCDAFCL